MSENSKKKDKKYTKVQRNLRQRKPVETENSEKESASDSRSARTTPRVPAVPRVLIPATPPSESSENKKRERDEVLNISEEADSKYKKKEIKSNWSKYEVPLETYDEINEQQSLGADYATLVGAPHSASGHFQFKHEKYWDAPVQPQSEYFKINMPNLYKALSTIPFYARNQIDPNNFSASDMFNMDKRALRFKKEYYKDDKSTPEDGILDSLRETLKKHFIGDKHLHTSTVIETVENETPDAVETHTPTENVCLPNVAIEKVLPPTEVALEKLSPKAFGLEEGLDTAYALQDVCPVPFQEVCPEEEETPTVVAPPVPTQAEKLTIRDDDDIEELEQFAMMAIAKNKAQKNKHKRPYVKSSSNIEPETPQANISIEAGFEVAASVFNVLELHAAQKQAQLTGKDVVIAPEHVEQTANNSIEAGASVFNVLDLHAVQKQAQLTGKDVVIAPEHVEQTVNISIEAGFEAAASVFNVLDLHAAQKQAQLTGKDVVIAPEHVDQTANISIEAAASVFNVLDLDAAQKQAELTGKDVVIAPEHVEQTANISFEAAASVFNDLDLHAAQKQAQITGEDVVIAPEHVEQTSADADQEVAPLELDTCPVVLGRTASTESLEKWINEFVNS